VCNRGSATDAAVLDWSIKSANEQHDVDIGGKRLLFITMGGAATKQGSSRHNRNDFSVFHCDPIAHSWLRIKSNGEHHRFGSIGQRKNEGDAMVLKYATWFCAVLNSGECLCPARIPAEGSE
jgi:hypothetical protein